MLIIYGSRKDKKSSMRPGVGARAGEERDRLKEKMAKPTQTIA